MGRRPVPDSQKKKPGDYPQLAFRLSKNDKARLLKAADDVAKSLNKARLDNDPYWTKGDVFVKALSLGLEQLKKR